MTRARVQDALDVLRQHRELEDRRPASLFDQAARDMAARALERRAQRDVDETVARVTRNQLAHWVDAALDGLHQLARERDTFTVVDLRARLDHEPAIDWRGLGGVLRQGQRVGWIEHSGGYVPGPAASHHGRPLAVWRSLLRDSTVEGARSA